MTFVAIKIETCAQTGEVKYVVNALMFDGTNKKQRKIPHPQGNCTISFTNLEEAKKAIKLAGFHYILPDGIKEDIEQTEQTSSSFDEIIFNSIYKQTKDINSSIVASAIEALGEMRNKKSLDLFVEKMGEDNENIRTKSIDAILKFGFEAINPVINSLNDENWVRRNSAVICLGHFCQRENSPINKIIDVLLKTLEDKNPIVKCSTINALGKAYKSYRNRNQNSQ